MKLKCSFWLPNMNRWPEKAWIGLQKANPYINQCSVEEMKNNWHWQDRSIYNWTGWGLVRNITQPDDDFHCAYLHQTGVWGDWKCRANFFFVCQAPVGKSYPSKLTKHPKQN